MNTIINPTDWKKKSAGSRGIETGDGLFWSHYNPISPEKMGVG
jgi:hypothetical protein